MEKYSDQHDPCDIREGNDGKVGCKTVEYTKASPVLWLATFYGMV